MSTLEVSTLEESTPNVSTPEVTTLELSTPDVSTPDMNTPNVAILPHTCNDLSPTHTCAKQNPIRTEWCLRRILNILFSPNTITIAQLNARTTTKVITQEVKIYMWR